jgi:hypothetical protein
MVRILEYVDAISRRLNRDILWIQFQTKEVRIESWERDPSWSGIVYWLDNHNLDWERCFGIADERGFGRWEGQIYLDIHFDIEDSQFIRLKGYMEYLDGSSRFDNVRLCLLPLSEAMKNKHHDEPDFWEKWADGF